MTYEDILEHCKRKIERLEKFEGQGNQLGNEYEEHFMVAKLIEKQMPMKPREVDEETIRLDGIWNWTCGKCGRFHRNDYPLRYCSDCGQKVDWSDWSK